MCEHVKFPDGTTAIICGMRGRQKFCACGRVGDFECDWKVKEKRSGMCDAPICSHHALQVGPDKHLCPQHQKAWEAWQKRHPGHIAPPDYAQMSLLENKS
jgi:hypothetical protein